MSSEALHEAQHDLSRATRDLHRALVSLAEELQAIDWYRQRADACSDPGLRAVLLHNLREEMEHSALLIEWLRRRDADLAACLAGRVSGERPAADTATPGMHSMAPGHTSSASTIGSLKE